MLDPWNRRISYLRISVTDKCNLRCVYCMPEKGIPLVEHRDLLSWEELTRAAETAVRHGITKIRLTGGEPLVRRGIEDFTHMLSGLPGLETLAMTTNGHLMPEKAGVLAARGLQSVNISVDTLDPERYREITRGGDLNRALEGVRAARSAGLKVKINMVVRKETTAEDQRALREFCVREELAFQRIRAFRLDESRPDDPEPFDRPPPCGACNRIRLLARGVWKPCLHSDTEFPLDPRDPDPSFLAAVGAKPENGQRGTLRPMYQIGG